jgi:hypothetical protein
MTMTTMSRPETAVPVSTPQRTKWWAALSALLLLVGLAAGALVGRATVSEPAPSGDLASEQVTAFARDHVAAINSGDEERIASSFAQSSSLSRGVMDFYGPVTGQSEIARELAEPSKVPWAVGGWLEPPTTVMQRDDFVTYFSALLGNADKAAVPIAVILELDAEGKILSEWWKFPSDAAVVP